MRTRLNADALFALIREDFAMFSLKDPSLLDFDKRRREEPESLHGVFSVEIIPCDSQMRTILDEMSPDVLRRPFRSVFHQVQRGKVLPKMICLGGHLLLAVDGTGFYSSEKIGADYCLTKEKRNGTVEYHLQMLAGAFSSGTAGSDSGVSGNEK